MDFVSLFYILTLRLPDFLIGFLIFFGTGTVTNTGTCVSLSSRGGGGTEWHCTRHPGGGGTFE